MIDAIVDFMDAANEADRKLGYELAIAQEMPIEKIVRAWLEKRFRVLEDLKNRDMCYFIPEAFGCGFKLKLNSDNYEEYIETLNKYNIAHWHKHIMLKGFFSHTIIFQMDRYRDTVGKISQYHNNLDTLDRVCYKVQIPEYLF